MADEPLERVVMVRLSAEVHEGLKVAAAEGDTSQSGEIRSILTAELARRYPDMLPGLADDEDPR